MGSIKYFILLIFISAFIYSLPVLAQEVIAEFDFKEVNQDDALSHVFSINHNVKGIVNECECLHTEKLSNSAEIPARIKVTFDPKGY